MNRIRSSRDRPGVSFGPARLAIHGNVFERNLTGWPISYTTPESVTSDMRLTATDGRAATVDNTADGEVGVGPFSQARVMAPRSTTRSPPFALLRIVQSVPLK